MSAPPADTPEPERPIPWWRYRRRLFYLSLVVGPLALLWGGWAWWYWADFPLPAYVFKRVATMGRADPYVNWIFETKWKLLNWKSDRETRHLRLPGTAWRDSDRGIVLTFGADGRLGVSGPADWVEQVAALNPFATDIERDRTMESLSNLNLTPYLFDPIMPPRFPDGSPMNLSLPVSLWKCELSLDSNEILNLRFRSRITNGSISGFSMRLTRVPPAP